MALASLSPADELFTPCSYYIFAKGDASTLQKNVTTDDDFELFGEESAEDKAAAKKLAEAKKKQVSVKKKVVNKSMLVIEVKPADADTDLDEILKQVKAIKMEGLTWGEGFNKVPVAFGLFKLQVQCVILDDCVNTNALIDSIEELGMTEEQKGIRQRRVEVEDDDDEAVGLVQSAEIVSFNKL